MARLDVYEDLSAGLYENEKETGRLSCTGWKNNGEIKFKQ